MTTTRCTTTLKGFLEKFGKDNHNSGRMGGGETQIIKNKKREKKVEGGRAAGNLFLHLCVCLTAPSSWAAITDKWSDFLDGLSPLLQLYSSCMHADSWASGGKSLFLKVITSCQCQAVHNQMTSTAVLRARFMNAPLFRSFFFFLSTPHTQRLTETV